jgi:hypothetical protein
MRASPVRVRVRARRRDVLAARSGPWMTARSFSARRQTRLSAVSALTPSDRAKLSRSPLRSGRMCKEGTGDRHRGRGRQQTAARHTVEKAQSADERVDGRKDEGEASRQRPEFDHHGSSGTRARRARLPPARVAVARWPGAGQGDRIGRIGRVAVSIPPDGAERTALRRRGWIGRRGQGTSSTATAPGNVEVSTMRH